MKGNERRGVRGKRGEVVMEGGGLVVVTVLGIALLLFLVIKVKPQAFLALLLTGFLVGIAAGLPLSEVLEAIEGGMGSVLGFVAVVVGLGAMLGAIIEASGGAEQLAIPC